MKRHVAWRSMLFAAATFAAAAGVSSAISDGCGGGGTSPACMSACAGRRKTAAFVVSPSKKLCNSDHRAAARMSRKVAERAHSNSIVRASHHMFADSTSTALLISPSSSSSSANNNLPVMENDIEPSLSSYSFSESDAIRILRAFPYYNNGAYKQADYHPGQNMKACHTAIDVLYLLSQSSGLQYFRDSSSAAGFTPSSLNYLSKEELLSITQPIVDSIGPNIASAALRRLGSPPFLPSSLSGAERKSYQYMNKKYKWWNKENNVSSVEQNVYDQLMQLLLKKMTTSIEHQLNTLRSTTIARDNSHPTLLPHADSLLLPPTFGRMHPRTQILNWYALADALRSLSSICNVLGNFRSGGNHIIKGHLLTNISPREQGLIMNLFDDVVEYISWDDTMTSSFVRCVGSRRLVRDVVQPMMVVDMARMRAVRRSGEEDWVYSIGDSKEEEEKEEEQRFSSDNGNYNQILAILSKYLVLPHSLEKVTASDMSTTLWSMTKLYHPLQPQSNDAHTPTTHRESFTLQLPQRTLLRAFMKRLRKKPVRSSARGKDLVQALWSVARLIGYLEGQDDEEALVRANSLEQVLPLSIRLPGEDGGEHAALFSSPDAGNEDEAIEYSNDSAPDIPTTVLREEAVTMFHTLINEIVHPHFKNNEFSNGSKEGGNEVKLRSFSLGQIPDSLQATTSLSIAHNDVAVTVTEILKHLASNSSSSRSVLQQCRSCKDISRILFSLQRLRVGTGIFDGTANESSGSSSDASNTGLERYCVQLLGERFLDIVSWHKEQSKWACDAKTLAIILRSGVMMFQGNSTATRAMLDAASVLILDETYRAKDDDDWVCSSFLSSCNEFEVSNYLFAFALAKRFDESVFVSLTDQMAEEDILESCAPSSASRTMWSCAMLLSLDGASSHSINSYNMQNEFDSIGGGSYLHERLVDLFHQLSPLLLSASLSPTDTSCAMWAMSKSQYVIDKGIFDQLAQSQASDQMLERSNTRLVSQSLWSCAKMAEFEDSELMDDTDDDDDRDADDDTSSEIYDIAINLPPYVKCVDKYLQFLIANESQMTPKHISQSIWAIGRLQIADSCLIQEMGGIASRSCAALNAREIANIVWGLSKVDYDGPEIISQLIQQVTTSPKLTKSLSSQEAANCLFALGKLQIRDKKAFASLSSILRSRLSEATSQAVANALWAHEVVNIEPPHELLSIWAQERLGLGMILESHLES